MRKIIFFLIHYIFLFSFNFFLNAENDVYLTDKGQVVIYPIDHATFVIDYNGLIIAVDPVGGEENFSKFKKADLIIITDIHSDHVNIETLNLIQKESSVLICPKAVYDMIKDDIKCEIKIMDNGSKVNVMNIEIKAYPMYNISNDKLMYHPKGRGNGYVLNTGNKFIYISGDTENISEMEELKGIDIAFLCMNLPYTMDINQAKDAVLLIKPKVVYPYHFRSQGNIKSDVQKFKTLVESKDPSIEVRIRNWYKE